MSPPRSALSTSGSIRLPAAQYVGREIQSFSQLCVTALQNASCNIYLLLQSRLVSTTRIHKNAASRH